MVVSIPNDTSCFPGVSTGGGTNALPANRLARNIGSRGGDIAAYRCFLKGNYMKAVLTAVVALAIASLSSISLAQQPAPAQPAAQQPAPAAEATKANAPKAGKAKEKKAKGAKKAKRRAKAN